MLIVSGIILAVFISNRLAARHNIPFDSLLDLALAAYHGAAAFSDVGIGQYEKLGGERP